MSTYPLIIITTIFIISFFVNPFFFFSFAERLEEIKQEIAQIKTDAQDLPQTVSESITALERHVDSLLTGDGTESSNGALDTVKSLLWK